MFGNEYCNCHCHTNKNVKHIMPCCLECNICDRKIRNVYYNTHHKKCQEEREKLISKIKKEMEE